MNSESLCRSARAMQRDSDSARREKAVITETIPFIRGGAPELRVFLFETCADGFVFGSVQDVLGPGRQQGIDILLGLLDSGGGTGMGAEQLRNTARLRFFDGRHTFEH